MISVFVCENTPNGIFTGIYDAWDSRLGHTNVRLMLEEEMDGPELFCQYRSVKADMEKAVRVTRSIERKLGHEVYEIVYYSILSGKKGSIDAVYRFLTLAFSIGSQCIEQISHPYVRPVFERRRNVKREYQHYQGFLRFSELDNGVLFSEIRPENNILQLLGIHFADRFPEENWIIYEAGRKQAVIHKKGIPFVILKISGRDELLKKLGVYGYSKREDELQKLWEEFIAAVGIEERENEKLQRKMLPLRYREFMREYNERKSLFFETS